MAVFRVERNTGYTVMSNHHLRNKELSLKAKGLLSQMLSLPEDWDYTLSGLSYINRESIDAIRTAVWELEKAGYITRRQGRDEKGKMTAIEYTIYEQPQPPELDCPVLENPTADNPILENPTTDNPTSENPMQLNKDISRTNLPKKEKSNTDLSITHSIPIHSLNPLPYGEDEAAQPPERKRAERNDAYRVYEEIIKDNIEYDILLQDMKFDHDRLNEIVDIILETVCTSRKKIRIAGDDYPAELVKSKFMKLNSEHIRFVLDCMQENTTKIRNIKPVSYTHLSIGIIGGADGPTAIYVTTKLAPGLLGPIAIAAYSYMALVPVIQPPIMKALTSKKDRQIVMGQLRTVSKTEKIVFPIVVTVLVSLMLPSAAPLIGSLMLGNLFKESGVTERLSKTAQNELMNIVTIFLGVTVGATAKAETFLQPQTLKIIAMGVFAFGGGTAGGVLLGDLMCKLSGGKINPLIGSAGVSAVPMAARVSQKVGQAENPSNFLLMHAMGPNVAGVIGSAVAAGVFISMFG